MIKKLLIAILILVIIILGTLCIIDHVRMKNNEEVIFSTWGKKYSAPKTESKKAETSEKTVAMYKAIIDDLMGKSNGIRQGAKYISLDISSLKAPATSAENYLALTEEQENELIEYCKKYNEEVKNKSLEGLREEGLVEDTDGFIVIEGVLIRVLEIEKLTENKAVMTVQSFRTGLGAVMVEYELKYKNGEWKLTAGSMAIS